jgi:hypothetical protein
VNFDPRQSLNLSAARSTFIFAIALFFPWQRTSNTPQRNEKRFSYGVFMKLQLHIRIR